MFNKLFAKNPVKEIPVMPATFAKSYRKDNGEEYVTLHVYNGSYRSTYMTATVCLSNGKGYAVTLNDSKGEFGGVVLASKWRDHVIAFAEDVLPQLREAQ